MKAAWVFAFFKALAIGGAPILLLGITVVSYWQYDSTRPVLRIADDLGIPELYTYYRDRAIKGGKSVPFVMNPNIKIPGMLMVGWPIEKLRACPGTITIFAASTTRNYRGILEVAPTTIDSVPAQWMYFDYLIDRELCPDSYKVIAIARYRCNPIADSVDIIEGPQFKVVGPAFPHCGDSE